MVHDPAAFKRDLAELIPHLRAFARSLCGDAAQADDLAQDAMLKAWKARDSFEPGTNMKAWAFTILRNLFYSERRRAWRRQPLDPEVAEATLVAGDNPEASQDLLALRNAMFELPDDQREALILVGAGGLSYEDAAEICGCAVGTVKSRVSRARRQLEAVLENQSGGFGGADGKSASDVFEEILAEADKLATGAA